MSYQTLTSYDVTGSAWRNARRLASGAKRGADDTSWGG
jgi:hypothetical protein